MKRHPPLSETAPYTHRSVEPTTKICDRGGGIASPDKYEITIGCKSR